MTQTFAPNDCVEDFSSLERFQNDFDFRGVSINILRKGIGLCDE